MTCLFLSPRNIESSIAIGRAAQAVGWSVCRLSNWRPPTEFQGERDVVAYGEPLFVAAIAEFQSLVLIEPTFDWLAKLPLKYRNRSIELVDLKAARLRQGIIFAKPADDKCFPAGVYESGEKIAASNLLPESIPVILSTVVAWKVEYRCFVLDRKLEACSVYASQGRYVSDANTVEFDDLEAVTFIETLLNDKAVSIPPAVVIDIGYIVGVGWSVVEANPVFGAGIYRCDANLVLPVLARSMLPRESLTAAERPWVLQREEC